MQIQTIVLTAICKEDEVYALAGVTRGYERRDLERNGLRPSGVHDELVDLDCRVHTLNESVEAPCGLLSADGLGASPDAVLVLSDELDLFLSGLQDGALEVPLVWKGAEELSVPYGEVRALERVWVPVHHQLVWPRDIAGGNAGGQSSEAESDKLKHHGTHGGCWSSCEQAEDEFAASESAWLGAPCA